jgi:phenylpyruvate tautomerase PptA (4-oxalocrotonate tautomerase family)
MRIEQLTEVFVKHLGARKDGGAFLVPVEADAQLHVALEGETLSIPKITRIEALDTLVLIDTAKGERYIVAAEDIRAVRMDRSARGAAGFGK